MIFFKKTHLGTWAIICSCVMVASLEVSGQSVFERERANRMRNVQKAQGLLKEGDIFYKKKNYEKSTRSYQQALALVPDTPNTRELRFVAADRFAQSAVEYGKGLSRQGNQVAARKWMNEVLSSEVAPNHAGARNFMKRLEDPIRTNPALSPEHTTQVDWVRRQLYKAEGFEHLAKFDASAKAYEEVLRVDPYNKAARRGMERANAHRSDYFQAAQDEARSRMLTELDSNWELKSTEDGVEELDQQLLEDGGVGAFENYDSRNLKEKLRGLVFKSVDLEQVTLREAVDYLRQRSKALDIEEPDPSRRGVNFVVNLGDESSERGQKIAQRRFDLKLRNVPLLRLLDEISSQTGTVYRVDQHVVVFQPIGSTTNLLRTKRFRMPPDFLSHGSIAKSTEGESDPFAEDDKSEGGLLARKLTAKEFFENYQVGFPDGAFMSYQPATNLLMVRNTDENLRSIEQIVESIVQENPVIVKISATIIRVKQTDTEELSFDHLITAMGLGASNNLFVGGGTTGSGSVIADGLGNGREPITSGNRSGSGALSSDSIDTLLNGNTAGRAPGIVSILGQLQQGDTTSLMRGLSQKKGVDILTKPSILTRSGQTAKIESIREFIYPTEYEPPQIPNSSAGNSSVIPATPTAFETRNTGITMEVNPVVNSSKTFAEVQIAPEIVEFDGFLDYGMPIFDSGTGAVLTQNSILMPVFRTIRTDSRVVVADGATVVLGGLLKQGVEKVDDKVPVLGSLPLVGRFFQSEAYQPVSQAVFIFLKVDFLDLGGKPFRVR